MVLLEIFTPSYIEPILADMFRACFLFIEGCKQLSNHFVEAVDASTNFLRLSLSSMYPLSCLKVWQRGDISAPAPWLLPSSFIRQPEPFFFLVLYFTLAVP